MASVRMNKVQKTYIGSQPVKKAWWEFWKSGSVKREVNVIKDVSFEIRDGEFLVLVGPSGCGKSTALRMIAGLEEVTGGEIYIDEVLVNDVSPKDRDIAMVFQSYALYPHMNVYENMAFGLNIRKYPKDDIDKRVNEAAEMLGLKDLLLRKPGELSGGQRQRVAMGRAIVRKPKVFLMDEPLSNLDAKLRVQMRAELQKMHKRLGVTTVYVTHDQTEAMTLGDRIVILKDGIVQQIDSPMNLYDFPANKFVASFIGSPSMNFVPSKIDAEAEYVLIEDWKLKIPEEKRPGILPFAGKEVIFGIRPEHIQDVKFTKDYVKDYAVKGTVEVAEPMGSEIMIHIDFCGNVLAARVDSHSSARLGDEVELCLDMHKMHIFDPETEINLVYPKKSDSDAAKSSKNKSSGVSEVLKKADLNTSKPSNESDPDASDVSMGAVSKKASSKKSSKKKK